MKAALAILSVAALAVDARRSHFRQHTLVETNSAMNATMNDTMPIFFEMNSTTHVVSGAKLVTAVSSYPCPSGFKVIPHGYVELNSKAICNKLGAWTIARTGGGGSQDGPGYNCNNRAQDVRNLGDAVCGKWTVSNVAQVNSYNCPSGKALLSSSDASANSASVCNQIETWGILRTAPIGSFDGPGYSCRNRGADTRTLGGQLCANINLSEAQSATYHESSVCPSGTSLITPKELAQDFNGYCNMLSLWYIVRVSGGASLKKYGATCEFSDVDTGSLGHALCANVNR